jgi:hypothetical protein
MWLALIAQEAKALEEKHKMPRNSYDFDLDENDPENQKEEREGPDEYWEEDEAWRRDREG